MVRAALVLAFLPTSVFGDPGHGALEIHWHFDDLVWPLIAVVCIGLLIRKALKR